MTNLTILEGTTRILNQACSIDDYTPLSLLRRLLVQVKNRLLGQDSKVFTPLLVAVTCMFYLILYVILCQATKFIYLLVYCDLVNWRIWVFPGILKSCYTAYQKVLTAQKLKFEPQSKPIHLPFTNSDIELYMCKVHF